ncbi:MAG: TRAP transporter substrate-binding protein [Paracoccus sp. (in: a-proteobacteria)]
MTHHDKLNRRSFLNRASLGAAAAGAVLAAPAIAQEQPSLNWRMVSSFPKSLDTIFGAGVQIADRLRETTDGRFNIQVFAAGELVPALDAISAVSDGTVECAHSVGYYNWGKDAAFAPGSDLPFLMSARAKAAYNYYGGGIQLYNDFLDQYGLISFPGGNSGVQMGGWFRKEIATPDDLRGLKMRIGGLAGRVLQRLGVVPQQIAAGDIYASLEKGTIDAAEWIGPYDDEKLGFQRVAPYYYYPGFWEGGPTAGLFIARERWNELPPLYQALVRNCAQATDMAMTAQYDFLNPPALKRLIREGAQLRAFSEPILSAAYDAAIEVYDEISAENDWFRRQWQAAQSFRDDWYLYAQTAEYTFDTFMMIQQRQGKLTPTEG